jgi:hypothetical protein
MELVRCTLAFAIATALLGCSTTPEETELSFPEAVQRIDHSDPAYEAVVRPELVPGCASAQAIAPREGYILAHDHGWVELGILDDAVPMYRSTDDSGRTVQSVPESCGVTISLNGEPFLISPLYPAGSSPPYRVDSGFRFPAPVGLFAAKLAYSGCRGSADADREFSFVLTVASGQVTEIAFDGDTVDAKPPTPDEAVTLQSLDARLQRIERALGR